MHHLDAELFDLINRTWTSPFLDRFMSALSSLHVWRPFMIAGAVWLLIRGGRTGLLFILSVAVGLLLGDALVSNTLKRAVGRPRPRDVQPGALVRNQPTLHQLLEPPTVIVGGPGSRQDFRKNSFPSSHVINMSMLATVAFRFRRWVGLLLGSIALAVAWSRIYCGVHWPSDIPPSILLGILSGIASVWLVQHIALRVGRREDTG